MQTLPKRKSIRLSPRAYDTRNIFTVTINTHHRHRWFQLYPSLSNTLVAHLGQLVQSRKTSLPAWCLMPDHLHLLIQDDALIDFVREFKGKSVPLARKIEPTRRLWQKSFYDHALRKEEDVNSAARYIWENPVRVGLVSTAVGYPFSGSFVWPDWGKFYE